MSLFLLEKHSNFIFGVAICFSLLAFKSTIFSKWLNLSWETHKNWPVSKDLETTVPERRKRSKDTWRSGSRFGASPDLSYMPFLEAPSSWPGLDSRCNPLPLLLVASLSGT